MNTDKSSPTQPAVPESPITPALIKQEVGYAISSRDFMVFLDGMPTIKINDLVISEKGKRGWVSALHKNQVEVLMLDEGVVNPGELFRRSDTRLSVNMGEYLLGWLIAMGFTYFNIITASVSVPSVFLAFGVSALIGIVFGYYPARRAAGLNPIEALRYE
jgi:hypothetical protein